jgi:hypothetical protein
MLRDSPQLHDNNISNHRQQATAKNDRVREIKNPKQKIKVHLQQKKPHLQKTGRKTTFQKYLVMKVSISP